MLSLGALAFTTPWLLLALIALPVLWLILRAIPPAPIRRLFPAVTLLLGLKDEDHVSDRTPWWLLLLRCLAVAAVILGLAGPILNPRDNAQAGDQPLMVLLDASWASGTGWAAQIAAVDAALAEAERDDRPAALIQLTDPQEPAFRSARDVRAQLSGLAPEPWTPRDADMAATISALASLDPFDTLWLSDGVARDNRVPLLDLLTAQGRVQVIEPGTPVVALGPAKFADGAITLTGYRRDTDAIPALQVAAFGTDPNGTVQEIDRITLPFDADATVAEAVLDLPAELRARLTRFAIVGQTSAGAVSLPDDSLARREVALFAGRDDREGLELLSPVHFLTKALEPTADLLDAPFGDVLPANPDVIILADVVSLTAEETEGLTDWVSEGGLLLRFAGPRVAASDLSRDTEDPLMPVRLRAGGRTVGGAMSWGEPKSLAPFPAESPFFGLSVPDDVRISAQVMAQPDPTLADRVIALLSDGTPLVTRKRIGQGQVVLMHVSANAEWSTLPLSGLFVQMLERLAVSTAITAPDAQDLAGTFWEPAKVLDGFGTLRDASTLPGVSGETLAEAPLGPDMRPGLYTSGDRAIARNVIEVDAVLTAATWPAGVSVAGLEAPQEQPLGGWLLAAALALLLIDILASLWLSGRLGGMRGAATTASLVLGLALAFHPHPGAAQSEELAAIEATKEIVLAHVLTGDRRVDEIAEAGLRGLSQTLFQRTSVEPAAPRGVNLERDELAFYPMLYWPITADQPLPSREASARLNAFLRSGGLILFDTRDADVAGFGASSPEGRKLQQIARTLDIPALEPVPGDHVLTRTFYLLQDFPGRHAGRDVWVEAAPPDAQAIEGMPFRNLNDGVTPVIIGGNDWAAAWARDTDGRTMFPVGRGFAGERQREMSYRFGVNLVMHVLTGNYKSDQVHVPALLERLGQ
ncbi:DUF4159 domain-containing protein [Pseudaestuariivita atlantica]|uniref:LytTR family transcriptional regulator n=1 Tax=Pseudaestuariivita atlantica TaxID=1317121 RepID=A0A0L1JPS3_9RHOB|nr:DUF4159 domain-containing protein [Pseudaestuariivita atlantica]KNG93765.1 LytTR family transcriptional regulator [Pseudaestuariivita atlantica]